MGQRQSLPTPPKNDVRDGCDEMHKVINSLRVCLGVMRCQDAQRTQQERSTTIFDSKANRIAGEDAQPCSYKVSSRVVISGVIFYK